MDHNLILEVDGKQVRITKAYKMWEFDTCEGEPLEMYSIGHYTLEAAIAAYIEELEEIKSE